MELTELIDVYRGPLVGLIASWGAPWTDATEIAQESFAEAYLNRDACRGDWQEPEYFGRWLRGVARNCYRNWARRQSRRRDRVTLADPAVLNEIAAHETEENTELILALRQAIDHFLRNIVRSY